MDEGDRSDGGDEPDRKTGSADSDPVNDGDFSGDDGNGGDQSVSKEDCETGPGESSETGSADTETPSDERGRASDDRIETGQAGSKPSRGRGETGRDRTETDRDSNSSGKGVLYRFRHNREGPLMWIREMLSSVAIVLVIGLILFGVSGVWPPMVAVESGSMEPNIEVGDLVFVTEPGRLAPDAADNDIGVVTHEVGETADYQTFGSYGSVVIYRPPGRTTSPIIHRAMFHVEEGENWHDRADGRYHNAADCGELNHCPAPHDGFITLGDNNGEYDQANGLAAPVKADWVTGVARVRVPYLGYVRLITTGQADLSDVLATSVVMQTGGVGADADGVSSGSGSSEKITVPDAKPIVSGGEVTAEAVA